jgi:ATP-dependent Clp protease adaptor protein ClpS
MTIADIDVQLDEKITMKVLEPSRYKVVLLNDDHTPVDFVIALLISVFKHTSESAHEITMKVHNEGSGIAGIYLYEIAEQKGTEATQVSRDNGFPLQIKIVEE